MLRLARINGEQSYTHGFFLRELTAGKGDSVRGRIIGSAWVASNCNSNWNGTIFRIDLARRQSINNVLNRGVSAYGGAEVKISIEDRTVTFDYGTGMGDLAVLTRAGIARYRVQGSRATREAPIASSFGGFISEWLQMDDAEAAGWSAPAAGVSHRDVAERFKNELFEWQHVAACAGPSHAREIAIRWDKSMQTTIFLISASSAADMRLLSVTDQRSPSCQEIDISSDLSSIIAEPQH
jgi:hypothetical protein